MLIRDQNEKPDQGWILDSLKYNMQQPLLINMIVRKSE